MKPLLLGLGLQGKATLHDLERSPSVERIVVADQDATVIGDWIGARGYGKSRAVAINANDRQALLDLVRGSGCDIVICMLPATFNAPVASVAIEAGVPFVSSSYAGAVRDLDAAARDAGVTVLPEMGFDPGIDLVLARLAINDLDEVEGLNSYGAGVPEPEAADNPLKYKITWTFDGVLKAYKRDALMLRDGLEVHIPGSQIFRPENIHMIDVPGVGKLEAYPNGDALHFIREFGLGTSLRHMGRYAARYPGHAQFWSMMSDLGFLDDVGIDFDGVQVIPHQFLVRHLTPQLQFREGERDIAILRVEAWGVKDGRPLRITYDLLDYRDEESGLFAMNRTVGYTASIAAHLVHSGVVRKAGVLSPARDVPGKAVLDELARRDVRIERRETVGLEKVRA